MKTNSLPAGWLIAVMLVLLAAGCATKPGVDWGSRVGSYTFDQAVGELGPPDRQVSLSNGNKVAEWVTGRSSESSFSLGFGSYGSHTGVGMSQSVGSGGHEKTLRLTFDTDGKLTEMKRN